MVDRRDQSWEVAEEPQTDSQEQVVEAVSQMDYLEREVGELRLMLGHQQRDQMMEQQEVG